MLVSFHVLCRSVWGLMVGMYWACILAPHESGTSSKSWTLVRVKACALLDQSCMLWSSLPPSPRDGRACRCVQPWCSGLLPAEPDFARRNTCVTAGAEAEKGRLVMCIRGRKGQQVLVSNGRSGVGRREAVWSSDDWKKAVKTWRKQKGMWASVW